jgi:cytoskeletal protein RodZ
MTSEELRAAALAASAKRGKSVAQRRLASRWFAWTVWSVLLPVIGLLTVATALAGMAYWKYKGHDAAYVEAQTWVQQTFGRFKTEGKSAQPARTDNDSWIPLTSEATPDLQIDRELTFKPQP